MIPRRVLIHDIGLLTVASAALLFLLFEYDIFRGEGPTLSNEPKLEFNELLLLGAFVVLGLLAVAWNLKREQEKELEQRIAAERRAHSAARYDPLTGLPNRLLFAERTGEALGKAWSKDTQCAVLFIDLDGFKPVNDAFGHATGDAVLIEVANRLRQCIPDPLNVGRLGGDEFAALIEDSAEGGAFDLSARRIMREIGRPMIIGGKEIKVGATIGIAVGPDAGRRAEDLIHAADVAMYEGKRRGKGTVRTYEAA